MRFLQLKNPWSHLRWKGRYSERDEKNWTPDLLKYLNFDPKTAQKFDNGILTNTEKISSVVNVATVKSSLSCAVTGSCCSLWQTGYHLKQWSVSQVIILQKKINREKSVLFMLHSHEIRQTVDSKPIIIQVDESRTCCHCGDQGQRCQNFKYLNFLPSSTVVFTSGCYLTCQTPHWRRKMAEHNNEFWCNNTQSCVNHSLKS